MTPSSSSIYARSAEPRGDTPRRDANDAELATRYLAATQAVLESCQQRLVRQAAIEQARGMLMGYYGINAEMAKAVLTRWASHAGRELHDFAVDLVQAGSLSSASPFGSFSLVAREHVDP